MRDFNARFAAGAAFVVRKKLRFPSSAPASPSSLQADRLEELWLSLAAGRKGADGSAGLRGSFKGSFKGPMRAAGGSMRSVRGSSASFKGGVSGVESDLTADGDVMRYEGRRWKRVPGQNLKDRLVTEVGLWHFALFHALRVGHERQKPCPFRRRAGTRVLAPCPFFFWTMSSLALRLYAERAGPRGGG